MKGRSQSAEEYMATHTLEGRVGEIGVELGKDKNNSDEVSRYKVNRIV